MKSNRFIKCLLIGLFTIFIGSIAFSLYKVVTEKLPTSVIHSARESLVHAKKNDATTYASEKLNEAEKLYNDAMKDWALQNNRFFWFRDFSKTKELAAKSLEISSDARMQSVIEKQKIDQQVNTKLKTAEKIITKFESKYKNLPLDRETFDLFNKGKLEYLEAKNEIKKNNLLKAERLIDKAEENLLKADNSAQNKIERFYVNYPEWIKNEKYAEQLSKKGQTVVLINKIQSKCTVLKAGKPIFTFNAEFGANWMGDKMMKGDRSTPEGIYKITEKKKGVKTKYYKALLINYPNKDDELRFSQLKQNGTIKRSAQIGGLIEIHGDGGKGIHWTDGCIALTNKDMDKLYDLCSIGTPVIIVGSDKTMQEYFE